MATSRNQNAINITLSKDIHAYLTIEADALGVSRSAFISMLLMQDKRQKEALNAMNSASDLARVAASIKNAYDDGQLTFSPAPHA